MNKKLLLILLVVLIAVIAVVLLKQNDKTQPSPVQKAPLEELDDQMPPPDGVHHGKKFVNNIGFPMISRTKDGKNDGFQKVFFPNGNIYQETLWKNGEEVFFREYDKWGNLVDDVKFLNGKKHGIQQSYYSTGKLKQETEWNQGRVLSSKSYDEAGNLN